MPKAKHSPEELDQLIAQYSSGPEAAERVPTKRPPTPRKPSRYDQPLRESYTSGQWMREAIPHSLLKEVRMEIIRAARSLEGPNGERVTTDTRSVPVPREDWPDEHTPMVYIVFRARDKETQSNHERSA